MAEQPEAILTSEALTFVYKIPTAKFSGYRLPGSLFTKTCFAADLAVNTHQEYPDIPPSIWTITVTIVLDGGITVDMTPKEGPDNVKTPGLVMVDWRVRGGKTETGDDKRMNPFRGECYIGPEGFKRGDSDSLKALVGVRVAQGVSRFCLETAAGVHVWVGLTFAVAVSKPSTSRVLETLYESSILADCTLICDEREFPAHRAILAAQSPVFAAMFESEMQEKASGICRIKDICEDVLDALLQFVYTREITKANGKLDLLWIAADRYCIQDLKLECERLMLRTVNDDNALDYLNFAAQRGLKRLKVEAAKIISQESG